MSEESNTPRRAPVQQELATPLPETTPQPPAPETEVRKTVVIPEGQEQKDQSEAEWEKTLAEARALDREESVQAAQTKAGKTTQATPQQAPEVADVRQPAATPTPTPDAQKQATPPSPPTEANLPRQNFKTVENPDPNRDLSFVNVDLSHFASLDENDDSGRSPSERNEAEIQTAVEAELSALEQAGEKKDEDHYTNALRTSEEIAIHGRFNAQELRNSKAYTEAVDKNHQFVDAQGPLRMSRVRSKLQPSADGAVPMLRGSEALMAVRSRQLGIYKVELYNSGFWIMLTPLTLSDMARFTSEANLERVRYGRMVGGLSLLYADVYMKQMFIELMADHLVDSNVQGLGPSTARDMLPRLLSFHDLDLLALYACIMTNPKGMEMEVLCTNPKCRHNEVVVVDLPAGIQIDSTVLNPEAVNFLNEGATGTRRTPEEIYNYRRKILTCPVDVVYKSKSDIFSLKVPTVQEYLSCGQRFLTNLFRICGNSDRIFRRNDNGSVGATSLLDQLQLNVYKTYVPWIEKITFCDENGKPMDATDDPVAIEEAMNIHYGDSTNITSIIHSFQNLTKAWVFGFHGLYCKKCGKTADFTRNDFLPSDAMTLFFALSLQRLTGTETSH